MGSCHGSFVVILVVISVGCRMLRAVSSFVCLYVSYSCILCHIYLSYVFLFYGRYLSIFFFVLFFFFFCRSVEYDRNGIRSIFYGCGVFFFFFFFFCVYVSLHDTGPLFLLGSQVCSVLNLLC